MTYTPNDRYSDELLNAFVDDELSIEDKERIYRALEADAGLRQRVDELRRLKDLTRTAFQSIQPDFPHRAGFPARQRISFRIAAGLAVLAVGVGIGYGLATRMQIPVIGEPMAPVVTQNIKVLFNVSRDDPEGFRKVLDQADLLLKKDNPQEPVAVRVVAHLGGLRFLGVKTAFSNRIQQMQTTYPGRISFLGCTATKRQWEDTGAVVELLPQVVMVESGIYEIVRREQQGWTHIHI
ncbi:MAG: hypothetical protein OES09_10775 [Gammaproteobacteria bacterium]|nr:hypothetical protein [Gammaproteobacteria bacterium]